MDKLGVRSLQAGDIEHIAANIREADRCEVIAAGGGASTRDAIARAVLRSASCWVGATAAEPVFIFGLAPVSMLEGAASPWMLGTDRVKEFPRDIVRLGRRHSRMMLEEYPVLVNFVDARNTRSIRWLQRIGYKVFEPAPYGVLGLPFHRFEMRA